MPVYKALILNKELSVNYDENQKEELLAAIKSINLKLESYDNQNGKISDSKLLSFLAINLESELLELKKNYNKEIILEKKIKNSKHENIDLNDQLYKLKEENNLLRKEYDLVNEELIKLQSQIDIIISLLKEAYE